MCVSWRRTVHLFVVFAFTLPFLTTASARAQSACPSINCDDACLYYDDIASACVINGNCPPPVPGCPSIIPPIPEIPTPLPANDRTFVWTSHNPSEDCNPLFNAGLMDFRIPVTRYVGRVHSKFCRAGSNAGMVCTNHEDCPGSLCHLKQTRTTRAPLGILINPSELVSAGSLGPYARLIVMAWDVDTKPTLCGGPGEHRVYFNGRYLGVLQGDNRRWHPTVFYVPIEQVKFPALSSKAGEVPTVLSENIIEISDDSDGGKCWCIDVGWISLEIMATSPVVLIHGSGVNKDFWTNPAVTLTDALKQENILFDAKLSVVAQSDFPRVSLQISEHIQNVANHFGVDSLHLVAHSMGGLHSLDFLANFYNENDTPVQVLSLTTLSSPLKGSGGADLVEATKLGAIPLFFGFSQNGFALWGITTLLQTEPNNSLLTTSEVATRMQQTIPKLPHFINYNTIGSDADLDSSGHVEVDELDSAVEFFEDAGLPSIAGYIAGALIGDIIYQTAGEIKTVKYSQLIQSGDGDALIVAIVNVPNDPFLENDMLVTIDSAFGVDEYRALVDQVYCPRGSRKEYNGVDGKTHVDIADEEVGLHVAGLVKGADQALGDMARLPWFMVVDGALFVGEGGSLFSQLFECRLDLQN